MLFCQHSKGKMLVIFVLKLPSYSYSNIIVGVIKI